MTSFSNNASVSLFLFGVRTRPPRLKSLSTGALEGSVVLYLRKMRLTAGKLWRQVRRKKKRRRRRRRRGEGKEHQSNVEK